jgi:hypothetical protein
MDALGGDYPALGAIVSLDRGDYIQPYVGRPLSGEPYQMIVTFERLLSHKPFVETVKKMMHILEKAYGRPIDTEFAGAIASAAPDLNFKIALLQCRALSQRQVGQHHVIPTNIPAEAILFTANRQVPHGHVDDIRYIVYVDPRAYADIPDMAIRSALGRVVGRLNQALAGERFILMGPGRWGSSNIMLGVQVTYADIYHTRVLIEIAHEAGGSVPEISYGTHFFQDLVEANIHPLPLYPDDPSVVYTEAFFTCAANALPQLLPADAEYAPYIKVIDVPAESGGRTLTIVMNGEQDRAMAYLVDGTD